MALASLEHPPAPAHTIDKLVTADGTASCAYVATLVPPAAAMRDLADAVHTLAELHGAFPGLIDHAAGGAARGPVAGWLAVAAHDVALERTLLAKLTAAAGPRPSTPGHAASEVAVQAQRHVLEMLARSDRRGCATGAAIAFVLDWHAIRPVLEACADRTGTDVPFRFDGLAAATRGLLARLEDDAAVARAMAFGAQQMLAQHRGLWHLLEARASARAND